MRKFNYTKKESFMIHLSWYTMAFGRKLMKLGLKKLGSCIIEFGLKIPTVD